MNHKEKTYKNRKDTFFELFPEEKKFRFEQIQKGLFNRKYTSWDDISTLSKNSRIILEKEIPWFSFTLIKVFISKKKDTYKALLRLFDGQLIETVLMENNKKSWTICVSSQIGCAMGCTFCATGKMGFLRNLDSDEIIDQYRFWNQYIEERPELHQRISNIVFMGMGEPLANYNNVKTTIQTWLKYTDLGPTYITVSTVGILPNLEKFLKDPDWPHVRLAISLHSADPKTRKEIVPTSFAGFLEKLLDWCKRYEKLLGNRRHFHTFEYVMLKNVNDTEHHAKCLAKFTKQLGETKVNLIPYNFTNTGLTRSEDGQIQKFMRILQNSKINVTRRKTMGDDIAAACGQLITEEQEKLKLENEKKKA